MNLGDWPLETRDSKNPLPIFSWCGSDGSHDIVMPTYDVTESTLQTMARLVHDKAYSSLWHLRCLYEKDNNYTMYVNWIISALCFALRLLAS